MQEQRKSMHCVIIGRVQGVWFRAGTKEQADALKLTGWVQNLPDGQVEVFASGDSAALEALHQWLQRGPELANVDEVQREFVPWQEFERFSIK